MSRIDKRKNLSVVEELTTETKKPSPFKKVTITMRHKDVQDLEAYIQRVHEENEDGEVISKSLVIRKALRLLYAQKKSFFKI